MSIFALGAESCLFSCADIFFFQAEDGIRDLVRSRGLGDVYKRQERFARARPAAAPDRTEERLLELQARTRQRAERYLSLIHI